MTTPTPTDLNELRRLEKEASERQPGQSIDQHIAAIEGFERMVVLAFPSLADAFERSEIALGDTYQIIGALAHMAGLSDDPEVVRVLDYLAYEDKRETPLLPFTPKAPALADEVERLRAENARLTEQVKDRDQWARIAHRRGEEAEQLNVQLAGCSVAALGGTSSPVVAEKGAYGWSPSYQDVLDLRLKHDKAETALTASNKRVAAAIERLKDYERHGSVDHDVTFEIRRILLPDTAG